MIKRSIDYNGLTVWFCKPTTPLQSKDKLSKAYKLYRLLGFRALRAGKTKIMRNYTTLDLVRFNRLANENKDLKPIELIKLYNAKYPEKTPKEKLINISKALGINNLHKALTGDDVPEDERWEHEA